jgi:hypothetical protein
MEEAIYRQGYTEKDIAYHLWLHYTTAGRLLHYPKLLNVMA